MTAVLALSFVNTQVYSATTAADYANWTKYDADGDGQNWVDIDFTGSGASLEPVGQALESFSWDDPNQVALTPDNVLISPLINCSSNPTVYLSWTEGSYANATYSAEHYAVYIVTNPVAVLAGTFPTPVYETTLSGDGPIMWQSIDISSVAGNQGTVYVVFRHFDCTDKLSLVIGGIALSSTLGADEIALEAAAYPNPTNSVLNINTSTDANHISIISMDGKVVASADMTGLQGSVNVADLVDGVYFYEVTASNGSVVRNTFVKK